LARARRPRAFRLDARPAETCKKQAAPANVSPVCSYTTGRQRICAMGKWITLGNSREPPVFGRFGGTNVETTFARAAGCAPKRLPSRRWVVAHHINVPSLARTRTRTATRLSSPKSCPTKPYFLCWAALYRSEVGRTKALAPYPRRERKVSSEIPDLSISPRPSSIILSY